MAERVRRTPKAGADLASLFPELAAEWHPTKNDRLPSAVGPGSKYRAWWQCAASGHEWQVAVQKRSSGTGCPYCTGQKVLPGFNDLATVRPDLAREWHPTKNEGRPTSVGKGSIRPVWWQCVEGHEWFASPNARSRNRGCPFCSGKRALPGFNDLATLNPELAAEWHPTRNKIGVETVRPFSHKKAWWQCAEGHEWEATIANRSLRRGCPFCSGHRVLPGFNDLATARPDLASEWHSRNEVSAAEVLPLSNRRVWWQCPDGHEWQAKVYSRAEGNGCPSCAKYGFKADEPAVVYLLEHAHLSALKLGITHEKSSRIARYESDGWTLLRVWHFARGADAAAVERLSLKWIREDLGMEAVLDATLMKSGHTETFSTQLGWHRISEGVDRIMSALHLDAQNPD